MNPLVDDDSERKSDAEALAKTQADWGRRMDQRDADLPRLRAKFEHWRTARPEGWREKGAGE